MHNKKSCLVYLCGPLDSAKDVPWTRSWREDFILAVNERTKTRVVFFDPLMAYRGDIKKPARLSRESPLGGNPYPAIVSIDLQVIEHSDVLVAALDRSVPSVGSYVEIGVALGRRIPIVVFPGGNSRTGKGVSGSVDDIPEFVRYCPGELVYVCSSMDDAVKNTVYLTE